MMGAAAAVGVLSLLLFCLYCSDEDAGPSCILLLSPFPVLSLTGNLLPWHDQVFKPNCLWLWQRFCRLKWAASAAVASLGLPCSALALLALCRRAASSSTRLTAAWSISSSSSSLALSTMMTWVLDPLLLGASLTHQTFWQASTILSRLLLLYIRITWDLHANFDRRRPRKWFERW